MLAFTQEVDWDAWADGCLNRLESGFYDKAAALLNSDNSFQINEDAVLLLLDKMSNGAADVLQLLSDDVCLYHALLRAFDEDIAQYLSNCGIEDEGLQWLVCTAVIYYLDDIETSDVEDMIGYVPEEDALFAGAFDIAKTFVDKFKKGR